VTDLNLSAAPDARCPMCRSLLMGMSGTHEFRRFPAEIASIDLFGDGIEHEITHYPTAAVQDFTATFVPCGCEWHARVGSHELRMYVLYIIGTDTGMRFEFGHRQHENRDALYVITHERTER